MRRSPTVLSSRITKRAKCSVSNCANGTSGLFGLTHPGASFMESSKPRSSASRDRTMGAKIMKFPCGVMAS